MKKEIKQFAEIAKEINKLNSGLYPGSFKDQRTFEAIISKYGYYNSELEFIIEMFISLQKCHVFHDGNKRTSLGLTQVLLEANGYYIIDEIEFVDAQILFIENKLCIEEFRTILNLNVSKNLYY